MKLGNKFRQLLGLQALESRIQALEEEVYWRNKLFYTAYGVSGLWGDYLEFGVFTGYSLSASYWSAKRHFSVLTKSRRSDSLAPCGRTRERGCLRTGGYD